MSYNFFKEEFENLTQDPIAKEFYYTNKGSCYHSTTDRIEKIFDSTENNSTRNILKEKNDSQPELNFLNTNEINYGIKFTSVSSGKNIIIHGGGTIATLGNSNNEDYVLVGGLIPRGLIFIEFICPISCQGLFFGMSTIQEAKDLNNLKKAFKSFRTTSRRRVGMEINYEDKIVRFFLDGILKDKSFSIKTKNLSFPCIILNNKSTSVILNPFARLNNVNFPLYLAPDTVYRTSCKSIFSRLLFLTNIPKIKIESKLNFLKIHFKMENIKEENVLIPMNADGEIKGLIILKFENKEDSNNFRDNNKNVSINNNKIRILEQNYLNDLTEKNIFKILDLVNITKKEFINCDISIKKVNSLESLKNLYSEEDKLIVEFVIENFNNINFFEYTISQMLEEINKASEFMRENKLNKEIKNKVDLLKENSNLKIEYLPNTDKMFLIDNDAVKVFSRNSNGFFDFEFYEKESSTFLDVSKLKGFNSNKTNNLDLINILLEINELNFFLNNIPWTNIISEIIDFPILKCLNNFVNGLKNIKVLNNTFLCFPLKKKYTRKFIEIILNYLNRIVFIMREKNKIHNNSNHNEVTIDNVEMDQCLPFPPEYDEPLNEESKKICFYEEYKNLSTETILFLYKIILKISEQIEVNVPLSKEKHSSISQCVRWGSALSRLSTFISFPNLTDKISAYDLADKGFYVDHTLYNEIKFHGQNFIRSLNFNKIKDQESLDNVISQEYPFNFNNLTTFWPNVELAYSINAHPVKFHHNPINKETFKVSFFNKSNNNQLLVTASENGLINIWDYNLALNFLGYLNVKKGMKEIVSFNKISEVFWLKEENTIKSLYELLNEENYDISAENLNNGNINLEKDKGKDNEKEKEKENLVLNTELVNNLYIMGFPLEASKFALKENKNNFDKALEYLLEKSSDPEFMKKFGTIIHNTQEETKISPWNCGLCTYLNLKGLLNCEMCGTLIPDKILNEHMDLVNRKKEDEILRKNVLCSTIFEEEQIMEFKDCVVKNVHVIFDKNDPMAPVLVCAVLFDFVLNKTIISLYKLMLNPVILRDFISFQKDYYICSIDNRKFNKLEEIIGYITENYAMNILSLYPLFNKGINSIEYPEKFSNFLTLIPIEHYSYELNVNSYFDSYTYENNGNSILIILSESLDSEINLNYFTIKNKSKIGNLNFKSIELEKKDFNINNFFKSEFPTELKVLKDNDFIYIIDSSKIRKFDSELNLIEIIVFENIGLFRKIEPFFNQGKLEKIKIYDDVNKFTEVLIDSNSVDLENRKLNNDFSNQNSKENISVINPETFNINEIEYLCDLLDFEKVDLKLNNRKINSIIKGNNPVCCKKLFFNLKKFSLDKSEKINKIKIDFNQNIPLVISNINFYLRSNNKTLKNLNYFSEEIISKTHNHNHLKDMNTELDSKNDLHNLIPLTVTDFKGAQFQQFINVSSIIFGKSFTSNYFKPEFLFSHIHEKLMFVTSIVIGSELISKTGEIPLGEGLVFMINDLDSITLAHEFTHFDLNSFSNFVKNKEIKKEEFFEWEPVAYINMGEKEYVRTKIYQSRPCKYILLLPTNARTLPKNYKKGFNTSVMSLNLFAAEGNVYPNNLENQEYFNNSTNSLLSSNGISLSAGIKVNLNAFSNEENLTLKNLENLNINAIIPNTFCSFENTDIFISKNKIENLIFLDKLISGIEIDISEFENKDFDLLGFTFDCQTFKKIDYNLINNFQVLKNVDIQGLRMILIDKENFSIFNKKFCDILVIDNLDFRKRQAIIKYFNYLILRIPSMADKICRNLNLTNFIIVNILQNNQDQLINSSLAFLISIKLSFNKDDLVKSILEVLEKLQTLKISHQGLNSFIFLINNSFNETSVNSNDSPNIKALYSKLFKILENILNNLSQNSPLSNVEIFLKNHLKIEDFPLDEKTFCVNKEENMKTKTVKEFSILPSTCLAENLNGSLKFTLDLNKIHLVKSIKINFPINDQADNYFKLIVWGSENKKDFNSQEFKILFYKNYLDDMWKQLTKYDQEIKANDKFFLTKDFRSLEISSIDYKCRYLMIEININQGQRILKKLSPITIIPEVIGEPLHDIEDYTFSSITELYESFISNRIENSETLNKKYEIKFNSEGTKYLFSTLDDKKENNNEKISNISQIVNSLKTYQTQLENSVNEYLGNLELLDVNNTNKLRLIIDNIKSLQRKISSTDKLSHVEDLVESQYLLINLIIKEIKNLNDKSNLAFEYSFYNYFDGKEKLENFILFYIESLIFNSVGELKEESILFLDSDLWSLLSDEIIESLFNKIFEKYLVKESTTRSSRVLLESLSKINFNFNLILNKLNISFEKKYNQNELSDAFFSISSLILLLIMKIKNEKNKNKINYQLLIESSLKIINNLTKKIKFAKEVDDLILSHSLNLLQESYSLNSFDTVNHKDDSLLVEFMIDTLFNLWDNEYIKNKLFLIINKMIDPSLISNVKYNNQDEIISRDLKNIIKYTHKILTNVQNFSIKFLDRITDKNVNIEKKDDELDVKYIQLQYILDVYIKTFTIFSNILLMRKNKDDLPNKIDIEVDLLEENIKDLNFSLVKKFIEKIGFYKKIKIGYSIENNLWKNILFILAKGDLKRLIKDNLFENLIFDTFMNYDDELKDILYTKINKVFHTLYDNEKIISCEINDSIINLLLKLIDNLENSEKITLPFLNQLLELVSCGESPFIEKMNEKLIISDKMKEILLVKTSNYLIKYLNYSSYTGSTSSNKLILQHLQVGISLLNIFNNFSEDYLNNLENITNDIKFSVRNYLIFITFNQYAEFTNVNPTLNKISVLSVQINKIVDIFCKNKKLIEVVLAEFMTIVRKIDEKLVSKIKNSEISIKKGIVLSKKLYYSLDLILNKCLYDDEITKYFAFNLQGFKFFVERVNRHKNTAIYNNSTNKNKINYKLNKELLDYLSEESKVNNNQNKNEEDELYTENFNDLNYEEFGVNGKLILIDDPVNINTTNINWSNKKKGVNSPILSRDLKESNYYEDVFTFKLNSLIELKNIFIGFTFSTNQDRVSGIIPSVFFAAGQTPDKFDTCVKLEKIDDNAYIEKSVYAYGFNFFATEPRKIPLNENYIENLFNQLTNCKAKYFKFIIRRPIITANENSFQNKTNGIVSVCLNHVSIFGTKIADMNRVLEFIQEEEKNVSIKIISKIFTAEFIDTLKYFAKDSSLIENIKEIYDAYEPYIGKHATILSNILINVSKYDYELGEWLLNRLLNVDNTEIHAKLAVEITQNNPEYVNERLNKYLRFILNELNPDSPIFYSNNTENKLINLGKFADYLCVILNGLTISPFFNQTINLEFDLNKFIIIIKNLSKYSIISEEINKLITILLIPNKKLNMTNYLDPEESILLLHNFYLDTNYYDYGYILSFLIANNEVFEKISLKRKIVTYYFEEFLNQVNNGIRGKNMLSLMAILKNMSFSNPVVEIITQNDYDFKILNSIKNKDQKSDSILINNNSTFLENIVTFLKNSIIKREDSHIRLAQILIDDLEVCKQKIDKIYANFILMPLLRMENVINLCMHPIDSFFNSILSAYCKIGHLTSTVKDDKNENLDLKFIIGSSLTNKSTEILQKLLSTHNFSESYKFKHKQFNLKFTSDTLSSNIVKTFIEGLSEVKNILILFYGNKPEKETSATTAFFLETNFPKIPTDSDNSDYPEYYIPFSEKNVLIQIEGEKFNKHVIKKYDSESIGELVNEEGYVTLNFFSLHDNPIRITLDSNDLSKKEFAIKISNKQIEKSYSLEFKPLYGSYFEIYSSDNLSIKKDSNFASGKILPSKYIDLNGNLDFEKLKSLKYYKKTNPLLITRNNPIYEIPYNITVKHLKNLFGSGDLNYKTLATQQILGDENELYSLIRKCLKNNENEHILDICYDINQLRGIINTSQETQTLIQNYEPILPVYKAFEKLDGIMKIIGVLKSSILLWKNKDAIAVWLKWIDDVEKFSVLPTFFSTLIRHQKCFNIIFDLLCGIYDQENFNKEICVETSNYIYEIINNTFIATESLNLRMIAIEKGIFKNILEKLEILTREKPRKYQLEEDNFKEEDEKNNKNKEIKENNKADDKKIDDKKSKKGVGYGSDHTGDNKSWDVNGYLENKKANSEQIASIIKLLANFFNTKEMKINSVLNSTILESVILPVLESAYRGGTLLELAKQDTLYYAYLELTLKISENKNLIPFLLDISKDYKPPQTESIYNLLGQLNEGAKIFTKCIKTGTTEEITHEEQLALEINKTYDQVSKNIKSYQVNLNNDKDYSSILKLPVEKSYALLMRELSFGYMSMKDAMGKINHYYASSLTKDSSSSKLIRLAQEYADLSRALPCEHTNSIFVRVDKDNMDLLKVLIMGSAGTPYGHGAFEFDVYFDSNYPAGPPKVTLVTTGSGSVRFNPNLYSNGKVCLSLLGTWRGTSTENWDPKISTFLQVLISIQSIIMSELVYFNEPSCEAEMGKPEGEARNEAYSNIVKYCNIKYAMIEQIKKPSKGFEEVVYRHFYLKKNIIIEEVKAWILKSKTTVAKYSSFSYDHNPSWAQKMNTQPNFTKMMEDIYVELEKELNELPIPSDLKKKQEESEKTNLNKKNNKETLDFISLENVDVGYENDVSNKEININDEAVKDRWSRYIGAMGIDAVQRQANSSIFLSGASGMGMEIAKNLVLSGCKKFVLHDTRNTSYLDLSSQFFLSEDDINHNRAERSIKKLQQLNFYVKCSALTNPIPKTDELLDSFGMKDYNVVILTQCENDVLLAVNKYCRKRNIILINADLFGVFGRVVNDFGEKFTVNDVDGEELKDCMIKSITNEKEGLVTVLENTRHDFQDGDEVIISEIEGMELLTEENKDLIIIDSNEKKNNSGKSINNTKHIVKVKNPQSFYIGDTTIYSNYVRNGIAKQIKSIKQIEFKDLNKILFDPELSYIDQNMSISDFTKISHTTPVHIGFQALNDFSVNFKTLPKPWNLEDFIKFLEISEKISVDYKYTLTDKDKKLLAYLSFTCNTQFSPLAAFFGGFIAQEALKAMTAKFMPLKQIFYYDAIEVLPEIKEDNLLQNIENLLKTSDFSLLNNRSDGISIIVGKEILEKMKKMKILVVGAGAIGCELLKNFSMLEVGTFSTEKLDDDKSGIVVTDPDIIEVSNLNRQFLFREKHLRLPKSSTAAAAVIQMNKNLKNHIFAKLDKLCEETEHIFTDKFFSSLSLVANALDNIRARRYVDSRCVSNRIPMLESGTLGPKGHVQVVVPFKTESYSSQQDPEVSTDIPQCTLKMFPEEAMHCIEWARDLFGKLFSQKPKNFNRILEEGIDNQELKHVKQVVNLMKNKPETFSDCIKIARIKFEKLFKNNIKQLMFSYPLDKKNKDGSLFWNLPKRPPNEVVYDAKDPLHYMFISSYACLLANQFKIKIPYESPRKDETRLNISELAEEIPVPEFKINQLKAKEIEKQVEKEKKVDKENLEEKEILNEENLSEDKNLESLISDYKNLAKKYNLENYSNLKEDEKKSLELNSEEFEKDNDSNFHIDIIYSMANLRCRNYKLEEMDWLKVKIKAGKIIPALATTTASIAGLQALELVKLAKNSIIEDIRNSFLNLAIPYLQASEPGPVSKNKLSENLSVTLWDRWEFKPEINNLDSVYNYLLKNYGLFPRDCFMGKKAIFPYNAYIGEDKKSAKEEVMNKDLYKLLFLNHEENYVDLMVTFTLNNESEEYIKNTPIIRILLK